MSPGAGNGRPSICSGPCLAGRDLMVVEEEITRLERLVQSFLLFGRPPRVEKKTLDVRPLVEQTLGLVAGRPKAAENVIRFFPPPEPVLATVDPGQFRQVLLNLLLNSSGCRGPRRRHRGFAWRMVRTAGSTLRVADNGAGLPAAPRQPHLCPLCHDQGGRAWAWDCRSASTRRGSSRRRYLGGQSPARRRDVHAAAAAGRFPWFKCVAERAACTHDC